MLVNYAPQISIFMTHLSNYGNDRLALLVFDSLTKYLQCWTNLKLSCEHPTDLAERYFNMYPDEVEPVWQVMFLSCLTNVAPGGTPQNFWLGFNPEPRVLRLLVVDCQERLWETWSRNLGFQLT